MAEREKILILGGTREATELAAELDTAGHDVTTSLAGRTAEPEPLAGEIRIGGFSGNGKNGAEGLAAWLTEHDVIRLIDATHPFARRISANAEAAARMTGIAFERRTRQPWQKRDGDRWIEVGSIEEARAAIPPNARVLLALGSQHIAPFATRSDVHFVIRMVDAPGQPLPFASH
ncbi:MAG: precorrin-6A/cobalt-precorrin-6A reductase, partial [Nitratireductor sp.]|nr:precorrin-6A/cobalt-precorrin-6A reductase [Nitratireductor sp.]